MAVAVAVVVPVDAEGMPIAIAEGGPGFVVAPFPFVEPTLALVPAEPAGAAVVGVELVVRSVPVAA